MDTQTPYPLTPPEKCDAEISNFSDYLHFFLVMSVNDIYKLVKFENFQIRELYRIARRQDLPIDL